MIERQFQVNIFFPTRIGGQFILVHAEKARIPSTAVDSLPIRVGSRSPSFSVRFPVKEMFFGVIRSGTGSYLRLPLSLIDADNWPRFAAPL